MSWSRRRLLQAGLALPAVIGARARASDHGRVVVVGGGFAGATAARYLRRWAPSLDVTLVIGRRPYWTCPFSNLALVGGFRLAELQVSRTALAADGIRLLAAHARRFDPEQRTLQLDDGRLLEWDRLVLAPGVELQPEAIEGHSEAATRTFPHAWQAGPQTALLAARLHAVPDGGLVVISVPEAPYRCPPGPYERASLFAWWLQRHRPRARLVVLDANAGFTKDSLFLQDWQQRHGDRLQWLGRADSGSVRRVDARRGTLHTDFDDWQPDLACVIPPQRAAPIARQAGLDAGTGWCPVDARSFASRVHSQVHVLGDAAIASPMPKSAFAAASQARVCAAAISAELTGRAMPESLLMNTCYSLLAPGEGISVAGLYRGSADGIEAIPGTTGISPASMTATVLRAEAGHARGWYRRARAEAFGD